MPFIKISNFKIFLYTDSTQNYINPKIVKPNFTKFPELFTIHTFNGKSSGKEFTFDKYQNNNIKSYIFKFDFIKEEITDLNKYKFKLQNFNSKINKNHIIEINYQKIKR